MRSPLDFSVTAIPMQELLEPAFPGVKVACDMRVLIRDDNHAVLGPVKTRYKVIQNTELFPVVEQQIMDGFRQRGVTLGHMETRDAISHYGRYCFREYRIPSVKYEIGTSTVMLRVIVRNGFAGAPFGLIAGLIDMYCWNGMVVGQADMKVMRHTSGLSIEGIGNFTAFALARAREFVDRGRDWATMRISPYQEMRDTLAGIKLPAGITDFLDKHNWAVRRMKHLSDPWEIEMNRHGPTLWAFYSALTRWATHEPIRKASTDNTALIVFDRQREVQELVDDPRFLELSIAT